MTRGDLKGQISALVDPNLRAWLGDIIRAHGIQTIVETGLDKGGSTAWFAEMAPRVIGVDNQLAVVARLKGLFAGCGIENVTLLCQNSPDALKAICAEGLDAASTLFFLDAHWQAYWPLRDEIAALPRGQGVLVMHDAVVPGHPGLGFDTYAGQALDYPYLKDVLTAWSPTHRVEYNDDRAEFPRRGVMVVFPS